MFRRRSMARVLTAGAVSTLMLATAVAPALAADITAPRGIGVARDAADPFALNLEWTPPAGTDHVRVSVFDGTTDHVKTYAPSTKSTQYKGAGQCTRYRVRIAAVAANGTSAEAGAVLVNSLAPGGLASITSDRADNGTTGIVSWTAPTWWGTGSDRAYRVTFAESSTGKSLLSTTTTSTAIKVPGLDKGRQYVAKVTPTNSFGSCSTSSEVVRSARPSPPSGLIANRDDVPSTIHLTWKKPTWAGYGSITHYRVHYGDTIISKEIDVKATEVTIKGFNPDKDAKFQVVAYDGTLRGEPTTARTLNRFTAAGTSELDPNITILDKSAGSST